VMTGAESHRSANDERDARCRPCLCRGSSGRESRRPVVGWRRDRDAIDGDRLEILLRSSRPVLVVHIDGLNVVVGRGKRGAGGVAERSVGEKYAEGVGAIFDCGGTAVVDDGERQIRIACSRDIDGRPLAHLRHCTNARLNCRTHLPEHVFDAVEEISFVLFVGMRTRLELVLR
jgi:hypothetical protein